MPITPQQLARNPGYARPPTTNGTAPACSSRRVDPSEFEASHLVDFSLNYEVPVYKSARPFVKAELRNAFNTQPLIGFDTTVTPDPSSPRDELGLPTGYIRGANFGTPLNSHTATGPHVPFPREFRFSVGLQVLGRSFRAYGFDGAAPAAPSSFRGTC